MTSPLADAYARRATDRAIADRDSLLHPATARMLAERQVVMWDLLAGIGWRRDHLARLRVLEVGCGDGGNLLDLLRGGFEPALVTGVELLADRAALARERLPATCRVLQGDLVELVDHSTPAHGLRLHTGSHDLVLLFTVLSSVLDETARERLAAAAWACVAPGGALLVYDFTVDNPRNPDVRGVKPAGLVRWWPDAARIVQRRLTLAPPLARSLGRAARWFYAPLAAIPWLCLHRMVMVVKPGPVDREIAGQGRASSGP